jgi:hypothetical protein
MIAVQAALIAQLPGGRETAGRFPDGVRSPAQYGPGLRALACYLCVYQHLPVERAARPLGAMLGASMAAGTLQGVVAQGAAGLGEFAQWSATGLPTLRWRTLTRPAPESRGGCTGSTRPPPPTRTCCVSWTRSPMSRARTGRPAWPSCCATPSWWLTGPARRARGRWTRRRGPGSWPATSGCWPTANGPIHRRGLGEGIADAGGSDAHRPQGCSPRWTPP